MVQSAEYIYNKLNNEDLLSLGFNHNKEMGTDQFSLVGFSKIFSVLVFIFPGLYRALSRRWHSCYSGNITQGGLSRCYLLCILTFGGITQVRHKSNDESRLLLL